MSWLFSVAVVAGVPFGKGQLSVKNVARNAVRIQYQEEERGEQLPDWLYVKNDEVKNPDFKVSIDPSAQRVEVKNKAGRTVFSATSHQLKANALGYEAQLTFDTSDDDFQFGLGQFQDGYSNIRGLSRRLTQVNTQISIPMLLSSKGYGVLWNNYGLTDFNPATESVKLLRQQTADTHQEVVNVTSTEGGRQEVRRRNVFSATLQLGEGGTYSLLLDVGRKMARRHNLAIDGRPVRHSCQYRCS